MAARKKALVSGIKPTGELHIGNYFGAMRQFVLLQETYDASIFVADYHALTTLYAPLELSQNILNVVIGYLAVGLDPEKVLLYKQSDVPEHTELAWIFNCITTMPYLMRAHAFKDAEAKNKEIGVGVFDYPLLMAADIVLHDADVVPVGQDQKQHIEIARDTAEKFNRLFGETFTLPDALIQEDVATVPGIDGRKMSKSYGNTIPLFAERDDIAKAVMGIVTDSSGERPQNVYAIHTLFKTHKELQSLYETHRGNYKALKEALIEDVDLFISPLRERRDHLLNDRGAVLAILKKGGEHAKERAAAKMKLVRERVGITLS